VSTLSSPSLLRTQGNKVDDLAALAEVPDLKVVPCADNKLFLDMQLGG
jgi:hypothetical protein